MGLYSAALMGGGAMGALGSPWVAQATGHWPAGLAVWAGPAMLAMLAWSRIAVATSAPVLDARDDAKLPSFTHPRAWLLALWFGLMNGGYTSLVAWLPHFYEEHGMATPASGRHAGLDDGGPANRRSDLAGPSARRPRLRPCSPLRCCCNSSGSAHC